METGILMDKEESAEGASYLVHPICSNHFPPAIDGGHSTYFTAGNHISVIVSKASGKEEDGCH
jgi:hypothetical protein